MWTTTPWTLLSNTGVAVNPDLTYAVVDGTLVADELVDAVLGEGARARVTTRVPGTALVGLHYERPFSDLDPPAGADGWRVVPAAYVTTEEGTGLVHLAPAFGEVDRQIGRANGLPSLNPVGPDGRFTADVEWLAGRDVRAANHDINDRLEAAGLLMRRAPYVHSYPHCWRCRTPLIYWGKPSWYIATSTRKDDLLAANATVDWHPSYIRDGRFGEWLANNVDWALSRDRYWGTPLPIWRCGRGHLRCVASLAELSDLCGSDVTGIDPHRPTIDEVTFVCSTCTAEGNDDELARARRVEPVIDAWFDSGSMPAAQVGYPHSPGSADAFTFPADFISEAIDQTRGWFYSLLAINVIVFGASPYRHVVCLGHIVDADGRKMSKSLGNIIDPWQILDSRGADAMRWWMFSQGSPWTPTRATLGAIDTAMRDMLLTLWNTFSFFTTYASLNEFDPDDPAVPVAVERSPLDRWILSRLASTTAVVTVALETYEPLNAAVGPRVPRRRPFQLVRAAQPTSVLAHRSRRPRRRHPGRPGDAAHGPDPVVAPPGAAVPLRLRHDVAGAHRRGRGRVGAPGRLAGGGDGPGRPRARGADGPGPKAHLARSCRPRRGRGQGAPTPRRGRWCSSPRTRRTSCATSWPTSSMSTRSTPATSSATCSRSS